MDPIELGELVGDTHLGDAGPVRQEPPYDINIDDEDDSEAKATELRRAAISDQALDEYKNYKKMLELRDWVSVPYTRAEGIACYELPDFTIPGSKDSNEKAHAYKASGVVENKTANDIARAHLDTNKISRLSWDSDLSDIGLLETINSNPALGMELTVQYAEYTPPAIAKRESVYFQWSRKTPSKKNKTDNVWIIISRHTDHPLRPVRDNPVRALSYSVMILTPLTPRTDTLMRWPSTHVTFMVCTQVGGWLPESAATALYRTKVADRIKFLRETHFV